MSFTRTIGMACMVLVTGPFKCDLIPRWIPSLLLQTTILYTCTPPPPPLPETTKFERGELSVSSNHVWAVTFYTNFNWNYTEHNYCPFPKGMSWPSQCHISKFKVTMDTANAYGQNCAPVITFHWHLGLGWYFMQVLYMTEGCVIILTPRSRVTVHILQMLVGSIAFHWYLALEWYFT